MSTYEDIGLNDQLMAIDGISGREDTSQDAADVRNDIAGGGMSARNIGNNYNLTNYGYAENFDSSFPFVLPFYIDPSVVKIQKVMLNLLFSKYRGFTKASAGESSHTHSVTIPSHTHGITGKATGGDDSAHQHTVTFAATATSEDSGKALGYRTLMVQPGGGGSAGGCGDGSDIGKGWAMEASESTNDCTLKTNCTISSHTHPITGITTDSGGGTTTASAAGSDHSHAMTYGIYEDSYPGTVSVSVISGGGTADVTTAIGGPFNPSVGTPNYYDLDITKYVKGTGLNILNITTSGLGRVFPVLWVKTVIGG